MNTQKLQKKKKQKQVDESMAEMQAAFIIHRINVGSISKFMGFVFSKS